MSAFILSLVLTAAPTDVVVLPGKDMAAKHIVLISGDEEYRSEDVMSQWARILNSHHGFKCTVLFALDTDGVVNPNKSNIPGLEALQTADLMCIFTRFRNLPDEQMQHVAEYIKSGKPIIGLRTATHAFNNSKGSKYAKYAWNNQVSGHEGGFGKQILGETWVSHHGKHGSEGTRGRIAKGALNHVILNGIREEMLFGTTDVYTANPPKDATILVFGEVTDSLKPDSKAVTGKKNEPMMPIAWTRETDGRRVFTTTFGASTDLESEGVRRLLVNAAYWALKMDGTIPSASRVDIVGAFNVTPFGTKKDDAWKKIDKRPADFFK